jgi:hypothetical protein
MDSQLLFDQLKSLGGCPGPITPTTKQVYLRQFFRLRREQAAHFPSPKRLGLSKELQTILLNYPGLENDTKIATHLDRLLVTHFTCPDPLKPWREGNIPRLLTYFEKFNSEICFFLPLFWVIRHNRSGEKIF